MDKKAYLFRGRVKTDQSGNYAFKTMLPAAYPGRPKHIHFKVYTETGQSLTTQLYFEGDPKTRKDYLYNRNKGIDRTVVLKKNANGLESNFKIHLA